MLKENQTQDHAERESNTGTFSSHENLYKGEGGELYARGGGAGELRKFKARARANLNRDRSVVPAPRHLQCPGTDNKTERFLMGWCV